MSLDENNAAAYQQHLTAWAELDPENSLPHIMEANMHFALGHPDSALNALTRAAAYGSASSYSLEDAHEREEALVANGMDRDVARMLIASAWGVDEYTQMTSFGSSCWSRGPTMRPRATMPPRKRFTMPPASSACRRRPAPRSSMSRRPVWTSKWMPYRPSPRFTTFSIAETQALLGQDLQQLMSTVADVSSLLINYNRLFETGNLDYVMNIADLVFQFGTSIWMPFSPSSPRSTSATGLSAAPAVPCPLRHGTVHNPYLAVWRS